MPQFLQLLMGYTAQQAGLVVSAGAGMMMITMPIVGMLTSRMPAKYLIAVGWIAAAASLFFSTRLLALNISFGTAATIMVMQFAPLGFIFVPSITVSYFGVPRDKSDAVSGLTNFMRNIGSSVGASVVTTILSRRQQFHIARLTERLSPGSPAMTATFQTLMTHGAGSAGAQASGLALIYQGMMGQAAALSYIDTYVVLATAAAAMFFLSFLLKSNDPKKTEQPTAQ
jgi:DHA2 family multidrug resistance protein